MEYQYDAARPLILERADLVVWLDLPTSVTMCGGSCAAPSRGG